MAKDNIEDKLTINTLRKCMKELEKGKLKPIIAPSKERHVWIITYKFPFIKKIKINYNYNLYFIYDEPISIVHNIIPKEDILALEKLMGDKIPNTPKFSKNIGDII